MSHEEALDEAMGRMWGICNDAVFWDGWRRHGDKWARAYCADALERGVDLAGKGSSRQELIAALLRKQ